MRTITGIVGRSPVLYAILAAANMLLIAALVAAATALIFRLKPRGKLILPVAAAVLALAVGAARPFAFATSLAMIRAWNVASTVTPFLCALILYPIRDAWKGLLVSVGYEFVAAVKYVVLLLFFQYDNDNVDDPLELVVELLIDTAALVLVFCLLHRFAGKRDPMLTVSRMGGALYLMIAATVVVFVVSISLLGSSYSDERHAEFAFTLLNIPTFAATVTFAALNVSKSRQQENAYKMQLAQQIQHYAMMEKMNEDLREFRHDLPKLLRPFAAYVENEDPEAAKEIAQRLTGFAAEHGTRYHTGNYRLDTVLFCEQQIAQKDGIKIDFTFGSAFPPEGIDPDDLYTIFPNALDNAIEACQKTDAPREIKVTSRIVGDEVLVTISNPAPGTVSVRNGVPQTSKRDKKLHGYGFGSMKKAAAKYGEDNLDFTLEDGVFTLRFGLRFRNGAE